MPIYSLAGLETLLSAGVCYEYREFLINYWKGY